MWSTAGPTVVGEPRQRVATQEAGGIVIDAEIGGIRHGNVDRQSGYSRLVKHVGKHRCGTMVELILNDEIYPLGDEPGGILYGFLGAVVVIGHQQLDVSLIRCLSKPCVSFWQNGWSPQSCA